MVQWETHKILQGAVQSPAPEKEQLCESTYAGCHPGGKQLGRKRLRGPDRHQVEHEPALCPSGKGGKWYFVHKRSCLNIRKQFYCCEGDQVPAQVAKRGGRVSLPEGILEPEYGPG